MDIPKLENVMRVFDLEAIISYMSFYNEKNQAIYVAHDFEMFDKVKPNSVYF